MSKKKSAGINNVFSIFLSSTKMYFLYAEECLKFLAFPIFGQLLGLILMCCITYLFVNNEDTIRGFSSFFAADRNLLILFWVLIAPFLILFVKALYEYLIAFAALNTFFYTVWGKKKKKNNDLSDYKNVIKRHLFKYIVLTAIVSLILITPPLVFLAPVSGFFLCLVFQIFALEPDCSISDALARSIEYVRENILSTFLMLILCILTTYIFFPSVFLWACDKISLTGIMLTHTENFVRLLPLEDVDKILSLFDMSVNPVLISETVVKTLISTVVVGFSLPFRCCCFTGLYKLYDSDKIKEFSKESDEIIKRATKRKN